MIFSLITIFISLVIGIYLKKFNLIKLFNNLIITLFLPSLILANIPSMELFDLKNTFVLASGPWLLFILNFLFISLLNIKFHWSRRDFKTLVLVNGLGNTAFLGYPLIKSLLGDQAMPTGIIIDQLGTFLALSSLATIYVSHDSAAEEKSLWKPLKRLLTFPPFMTLIICLILNQNQFLINFKGVFNFISIPLAPFAIMVLGMQINFQKRIFLGSMSIISYSLLFKLMLFPLITYIIFRNSFTGINFKTIILQSSMAPMFSSLILINRFRLNAELAAIIIFCGVIVSLLTVPMWSVIL